MQIHIHRDGQQYGPYSPEDITKHLRDGTLRSNDLAWYEGCSDWIPLSNVPGVTTPSRLPATPPPPITTRPPSEFALWNPSAAVNWSVLISPVFGALLVSWNYKSLGMALEAKKALIWTYIAAGLGAIVLLSRLFLFEDPIFSGSNSPGLFFFLFFGMGLFYFLFLIIWYIVVARKQMKYVKKQLNNQYTKKPWGKPLGIALPSYALYMIIWNATSPALQLPAVDAPEVVELAQQIIREIPAAKHSGGLVGQITISNPGEISYDKKQQKRVARAELKSNLGSEVIFYTVEWQNRSKGLFLVQIQDHP